MPAAPSFWQILVRRPQTLWLRRAIFQIHLWAGIALGIYIVVVCATGSIIVFRNDVYDALEAKTRVTPNGLVLSRQEMWRAVTKTFPGDRVQGIKKGRDSKEAAEVTLVRPGFWGESTTYRLADPYTGRDLGPAVSHWYKFLQVSSDIHGRLMMGANGLIANAIGGLLLMGVCITGMVIWWPGIANWKRALSVRRGTGWKRINFDLHSALGFWTLAFLFMWGATGAYFVFPDSVRATVNYFTPVLPPPLTQAQIAARAAEPVVPGAPRRRRPLTTGGKILRGFSYAHYGNFAGWEVKTLWVVLGFAPVVLFGTALVMWWNRVLNPVRKRLARAKHAPREPESAFSDV